MKIDEWTGCYPTNWKGVIVKEAMVHPAKFSSKLIRRIYDHLAEEGWVKPGDTVLDPFGGVALGALDAMRHGMNWIGVELEEKFVNLAQENIGLWYAKFASMPHWGTAQIVHGDSRRLIAAIQADSQTPTTAAISSPPYAETPVNQTHMTSNKRGDPNDPNYRPSWKKKFEAGFDETRRPYGETPGQLGDMKPGDFEAAISSPPFLQSSGGTNVKSESLGRMDPALFRRHAAGNKAANAYGEAEGQLTNMPEGSFDAAITSPPYSHTQVEKNSKSIDRRKQFEVYKKSGGGQSFEAFCATQELHSQGYGDSDGQLADMKPQGFEAAISSPPYDEARVGQKSGQGHAGRGDQYGETDGQLGGADDFWLAARAIIEQVYLALAPGGHAVWVTKRYVKNKEIVDFTGQWIRMCEVVGFRVLHHHKAMLIHNKGSQHSLDGSLVHRQTQSKSFFRRLAEKNGSPRIDWEDVICMIK